MNNNYKLTIGIISYNRPLELARSIKSLLPLPNNVEVVICDDKSPKLNEIESSIMPLLINSNIKFISNKHNLGYDRNLFNVIECSNSNHVLLLGDDDYLEAGTINNILNFIDNSNNLKCAFLRYRDENQEKSHRNYFKNQYFKSDTLENDGSFLYNSILFSGLLFSKNTVLDNKELFSKYFNSIYIQVSIFVFLSCKYGTYFINGPGVIIGGDGESGFGYNEASTGLDLDLKDRTSIISNLAYHKRLFDVIKKIEFEINRNIYTPFIKEYKIRSVKAIINARTHGRKYLNAYWKKIIKLDIKQKWHLIPVYFIANIFPVYLLKILTNTIESIIYLIRKKNYR